jgi:hypothetical protein
MLFTTAVAPRISRKLSENPGPSRINFKRICYIFYNVCVSLFLTPVLPITMWRGTWNLMDIYRDYFNPIAACLTGQAFIIALEFWRRYNGHVITPLKSDSNCDIIFKSVGSDVFNHIYNIGAVLFWRILWQCLDEEGGRFVSQFFHYIHTDCTYTF